MYNESAQNEWIKNEQERIKGKSAKRLDAEFYLSPNGQIRPERDQFTKDWLNSHPKTLDRYRRNLKCK